MKKGHFFIIFLLLIAAALVFGLNEFSQGKPSPFFESVKIQSPLPDQIIKGSVFMVKGTTKTNQLSADVKAKDSGELWGRAAAVIEGTDTEEKKFEIKIDTQGKGGWANLEIYHPESPEKRISFSIKISLSL